MIICCRISRETTRLELFGQCLNYGCFPRQFIKAVRTCKTPPSSKNLRRVTKSRIECTKERISKLKTFVKAFDKIVNNLNIICRIKLPNFIYNVQSKTSRKFIEFNQKLVNHDVFPINPEKYIQNLSSKKVSRIEIETLSPGFKSHILKKIWQNRHRNAIRVFISSCQTPNLWMMKNKVDSKRNEWILQISTTPVPQSKVLIKDHQQELRQLMKDDTIMLLRPDRGSQCSLPKQKRIH